MAETFFGPWVIRFVHFPLGHFRMRLFGTDNADGEYDGQQPAIEVSGAQWTLEIEQATVDLDNPWKPLPMRQAHRYDQTEGLVIDLSAQGHHCDLLCVSADPVINPAPVPFPYDFSLPG